MASQCFRSADGAQCSIAGYEAMNIIRKVQIRGWKKAISSDRCVSSSVCSESKPDLSLGDLDDCELIPFQFRGLRHYG